MTQKGYRNVSIVSSLRPISSLENNNCLPFLDVLVTKKNPALSTEVHGKLTHTGCHVHSESSHPPHAEIGVVSRAATICQE